MTGICYVISNTYNQTSNATIQYSHILKSQVLVLECIEEKRSREKEKKALQFEKKTLSSKQQWRLHIGVLSISPRHKAVSIYLYYMLFRQMTKNLAKQFTTWEEERTDHQARYKKNGELQRKKKEEEHQTVTNDKGQIHVDGL